MQHDISVWISLGSFGPSSKPMISCFVSLCLDFYIICLKCGTSLSDDSSCFCAYVLRPKQVLMIPCMCFDISYGLCYHAMKWTCYAWLFHARHFICHMSSVSTHVISLMSHAFGEKCFKKKCFQRKCFFKENGLKVLSRPQVLGRGNALVELLCPLWNA